MRKILRLRMRRRGLVLFGFDPQEETCAFLPPPSLKEKIGALLPQPPPDLTDGLVPQVAADLPLDGFELHFMPDDLAADGLGFALPQLIVFTLRKEPQLRAGRSRQPLLPHFATSIPPSARPSHYHTYAGEGQKRRPAQR
jgi:hypothetical protein